MKQNLLPTQCSEVAEPFRKAIAKSPFNVPILQLRISNLNEKGSLSLVLLLGQSRAQGLSHRQGDPMKSFASLDTEHPSPPLLFKEMNSKSSLCFLANSGIQRDPS